MGLHRPILGLSPDIATLCFALCGLIIVPVTLVAWFLWAADRRIVLQHPVKVRRSCE
jgi:hypothetical protein